MAQLAIERAMAEGPGRNQVEPGGDQENLKRDHYRAAGRRQQDQAADRRNQADEDAAKALGWRDVDRWTLHLA